MPSRPSAQNRYLMRLWCKRNKKKVPKWAALQRAQATQAQPQAAQAHQAQPQADEHLTLRQKSWQKGDLYRPD
eukprot:5783410-Amphidinium_carterae.1